MGIPCRLEAVHPKKTAKRASLLAGVDAVFFGYRAKPATGGDGVGGGPARLHRLYREKFEFGYRAKPATGGDGVGGGPARLRRGTRDRGDIVCKLTGQFFFVKL